MSVADRALRDAWVEAGPHEVADGIYRIPLPLPKDSLKAVNAYVVKGDDEVVLIDPGWDVPDARVELERSLRSLNLTFEDLSALYVTHMHRDHYTLGVWLSETFGTELVLGAGEKESIDLLLRGESQSIEPWLEPWGAAEMRTELEAVREVPGVGYGAPTKWMVEDGDIGIGGRTLRAVSTPGHTRGHFVFADFENGLLFSGDHVLPSITPTVGYETVRAADPLGDFLGSLEAIRALPDLALMPAHGRTGMSSHKRASQLLDHHACRLDEISDRLDGGSLSSYEVAQRLPWRTARISFDTLPVVDRMLAVGETSAHLDYLVERGTALVQDVGGVRRYSPPA